MLDVDPTTGGIRFEHCICDKLSIEAMVKARYSLTIFSDCGTEFPNKVITEYIGWFALRYITWAPAGFKVFFWDIDGVYILSSFTYPNFIGFVQVIANGSFGAIDFGEFVAKAIEVISFSNGGSFPDADSTVLENTNQCRPIIDV
jgi:hypothetical protein